jgi:hypothetical protein
MVKYSRREFHFAINPLMYLRNPHKCGISKSCPHTTRNIFDNGVLAIAFHTKDNKRIKFVPNRVAGMYNVAYGNVWHIGGYPCQVESGEVVAEYHFVHEVLCRTIQAEEEDQ